MYQIPPWAHPLSQVSQQSFLTKVVSDHFCAISDAKVFSRRLSETTFRQGSVAYITSFWPCPSLSLCLKPVWWWGCWGYISWLIGQSTSWTGGTEIRLTPFFLFFFLKNHFFFEYTASGSCLEADTLGSWGDPEAGTRCVSVGFVVWWSCALFLWSKGSCEVVGVVSHVSCLFLAAV